MFDVGDLTVQSFGNCGRIKDWSDQVASESVRTFFTFFSFL